MNDLINNNNVNIIDSNDIENEIIDKINKGLINELFEPILCECGSTDFNDKIQDMINYEVTEKNRYCSKCGKLIGCWCYGYWLP